jgi:hypothetical protein
MSEYEMRVTRVKEDVAYATDVIDKEDHHFRWWIFEELKKSIVPLCTVPKHSKKKITSKRKSPEEIEKNRRDFSAKKNPNRFVFSFDKIEGYRGENAKELELRPGIIVHVHYDNEKQIVNLVTLPNGKKKNAETDYS